MTAGQRWVRWIFRDCYWDPFQIIFCDLGTPKERGGSGIYGKIRDTLIGAGMPPSMVRFVHSAKTDAARAQLFADCRSGKVAVLIGSTPKLGTGVNVQERCAAIHHLDPPWEPAEVEQRDGRGPRPGNRHDRVDSLRYVTPGTFDAYSWETLLRKATFVAQLLVGEGDAREVEDLGDTVLSYAEVKAAATGDPLTRELTDVQSRISRLRGLATAHTRTQRRAQQDAAMDRSDGQAAAQRADVLAGIATIAEQGEPGWTSPRGERCTDRVLIAEQMADLLATALTTATPRVGLGTWSGVAVAAAISEPADGGPPVVTLQVGATSRTAGVTLQVSPGILAPSHRWRLEKNVEDVVSNAAAHADKQRARAELCQTRAAERDALSRQPFEHQAALAAAVARKSEIDEQMADSARTTGTKPRGVRLMPEELLSPVSAAPLDLPTVVIPASVAALIEEHAPAPVSGRRPPVEVPADTSETAEIAVGPPPPETAPWRGREVQGEFDVDIAALFALDEVQGQGIGLALTAAWAAIAPIPKGTQDALDFGNDFGNAATTATRVVGRSARRGGVPRRGPRVVTGQAALF